MTTHLLIANLRRRGVELDIKGENLWFRAKKNVMTEEDREALASRKSEILAILRESYTDRTSTHAPSLTRPEVPVPIVGAIEAGADIIIEPHAVPETGGVENPPPRPTSHYSHNSQKSRLPSPPSRRAIASTVPGRRGPRPRPSATVNERSPAPCGTTTVPPPSPLLLAPPGQRSGEPLASRPSPIAYPNPLRAGLRARTRVDDLVPHRATELDQARLAAPALPPAWDERGIAEARLDDRPISYFIWDGRPLSGDILGFDTETDLIVEGEVPGLALAAASSGTEHCLIHPDRLGDFVQEHRDRHLVFHNVAFDFWVVAEHLAARHEEEALEIWWQIADADRMHDTMLLDELIRLARTDAHPRPRNLAEVAAEYAGLELDKDDPYRLRYGEILGLDWTRVGRGFFEYAIRDPIATLAAYTEMQRAATELMEAHGHDPSRRG